VELEITPRPSEDERAAIAAALGQEAEEPAPAWPEALLPGSDAPAGP
jgi:hypothetical protein